MAAPDEASTADRITAALAGLGDWRGETLSTIRALIHDADPEVVEELKWVKPSNPLGVPTWSHDGIIGTGEVYKAKVKLTFARGASVPDPHGLFNASLDAGTRRAIDIAEDDTLDPAAFKTLIRSAVDVNIARAR
jgi:hypothetical protein